MKIMPSSRFFSVYLSYNPTTGILTWKSRERDLFRKEYAWRAWNTRFAGKEAGTLIPCNGGDKMSKNIVIHRTPYMYHRVCMIMSGHSPEIIASKFVDHINHDSTDNRLENLRLVDQKENAKNRSIAKNNKSGVSGVKKYYRRWLVTIQHEGRKLQYSFDDKFEAICKRKSMEVKLGYHANHCQK